MFYASWYTVPMSRTHSLLSREVLSTIRDGVNLSKLYQLFEEDYERKTVYDCLFRLNQQGIVVFDKQRSDPVVTLTDHGTGLLARIKPVRDGVWKIVIFDIPEKQRKIRNHLRNKLKTLGFKKWQESIWVSPFALDQMVESELQGLAKTLFIRLIKTTDINYTQDLEKLFA